MRVEFEFDEQKVEELGCSTQRVTNTLIRVFKRENLPCISSQGIISFEDTGDDNDFANMWLTIRAIFNSSWFLKCATACRFYDDSEEAENGVYEDVLSQAALLIRKRSFDA